MIDNLKSWETRRLQQGGLMRQLWRPVRPVYIFMAYAGAFLAPIPVLVGCPWAVISANFTRPAPQWWALWGVVVLLLAGMFLRLLIVWVRWFRAGVLHVDLTVFTTGILLALLLAPIHAMFTP